MKILRLKTGGSIKIGDAIVRLRRADDREVELAIDSPPEIEVSRQLADGSWNKPRLTNRKQEG